MTTFTRTWNAAYEATPADAEDIDQGAGRIREVRNDVRERLEVDHKWAGDADDGEHKQVVFNAPLGSAPATITGEKTGLWVKTVSNINELFYTDELGQDIQITENGAVKELNITGDTPYPPTHLAGFDTSVSSGDSDHDIIIDVGTCRDDTDAQNMEITSALTKQLDATFTAGNNQGMLDGGTIGPNNTYYIYVIAKADGTTDILASTSLSPTLPTDYIVKRRIWCVLTDASSNIIGYTQDGNECLLDVPVEDVNAITPPTSRTLYTMSVPTGIKVRWLGNVLFLATTAANSGGVYVLVTSPDQDDSAPGSNLFTLYTRRVSSINIYESTTYSGPVRTNTSAQFGMRSSAAAGGQLTVLTNGWIDRRDVP